MLSISASGHKFGESVVGTVTPHAQTQPDTTRPAHTHAQTRLDPRRQTPHDTTRADRADPTRDALRALAARAAAVASPSLAASLLLALFLALALSPVVALALCACAARVPVTCAQGWVVWRERKGLSEHVAVDVAYLGGRGESYTLNFSRPASGLYVQLFKFLRLGKDGALRERAGAARGSGAAPAPACVRGVCMLV